MRKRNDDDDDDDDERFDIGLDALAGGEDWRFFRYCNDFGVDVEWIAVHLLHGHLMLLFWWDLVGKGGQHHKDARPQIGMMT